MLHLRETLDCPPQVSYFSCNAAGNQGSIVLSYQNSVAFSEGEESLISLTNFWEPENGFVWSTGKWCEVHFDFKTTNGHATTRSADLILDIDTYRGPLEEQAQDVLVYLNGYRIGSFIVARRAIYITTFDPKMLRSVGNILTFDTPASHSPNSYGKDDNRVLGLQMYSMQFRKNS